MIVVVVVVAMVVVIVVVVPIRILVVVIAMVPTCFVSPFVFNNIFGFVKVLLPQPRGHEPDDRAQKMHGRARKMLSVGGGLWSLLPK